MISVWYILPAVGARGPWRTDYLSLMFYYKLFEDAWAVIKEVVLWAYDQ